MSGFLNAGTNGTPLKIIFGRFQTDLRKIFPRTSDFF